MFFSSCDSLVGASLEFNQANQGSLCVWSLFLFDTVIVGFQTILKNCQASSKFEAVNSTWLSSCQRHVRPIFEMMWRARAFSRVSTGDSDILSSCDMNDEHA